MKKGYSLLEILITVGLLIVLAVALLVTLNPMAQINKSQDTKRKHELIQLNKVFEDFYNDKQCYPKPSEVCYGADPGTPCNICGSELAPTDFANFSPYLSRLPCDPRQSLKPYLYQVDSTDCPTWYRIYTTLANHTDPVIAAAGCSDGCGPSPDFSYDYGVSSPNIGLEAPPLTQCLTSGSCTSYCQSINAACSSGTAYRTYSDTNCQNYFGICSGPECCKHEPVGEQVVQSYRCYCESIP